MVASNQQSKDRTLNFIPLLLRATLRKSHARNGTTSNGPPLTVQTGEIPDDKFPEPDRNGVRRGNRAAGAQRPAANRESDTARPVLRSDPEPSAASPWYKDFRERRTTLLSAPAQKSFL